jgi:predicted GIY-YIG superfamily endonuclease
MADRIWVVYGLIDPKTGWVFYIGITQNLERRVSDHQQQKSSAAWEMCQANPPSDTPH